MRQRERIMNMNNERWFLEKFICLIKWREGIANNIKRE